MNSERWKTETIGDLLSLEYGAGLKESDRSGLDYPVYGSNGVIGYHNKYLVNGPGIIVGRKGSVGAVHWSDDSFWPIDTAYYVETKKENINLRWCYWALQFTELSRLDSSTGVPGLNRNDVYKLEINLPIEQEQLQIAHILDTVDEAIQRTEQLIAKLKAIKQGLLHDLLTRGLDENGQLRDPIAHPEQFKDSAIGRIPKEWEYGQLKEFVSFMPGFGFPLEFQGQTDGEFPFFKVSDMELAENNRYMIKANNYVNQKMVLKQGWRLIPGEAVVFAKVGAALLLNRRRITTCPCLVDNNMMAAVTKKDIINSFIYWWMTCLDFGQLVQTTALPSVNQTQLGQVLIAFPKSKEEQLQIVSSIDLNDTLIEKEMIFLTKLKSIKKGLMHDLLTGKVRVNIGKDNCDEVKEGESL
jgi:type I restriction enzyme S subunit